MRLLFPRERPPIKRALRRSVVWSAAVGVALGGFGACGLNGAESPVDPAAHVVSLPGAMREIDFDDIVYSKRLDRVLIPARRSGLYLVTPKSGQAERVGHLGNADSADEGRGLLFVLDRDERAVNVLDPASGRVVASVDTAEPADYVRYVRSTRELWITEPAASPPGIEIFALRGRPAPTPQPVAFVPVSDGPEGLSVSAATGRAYTHAGTDVVAVDLVARTVAARWSTGCAATHGFPRVDEGDRLLLASCGNDGEVVLLDLDDGHRLDRYAAGGGEALPGFSSRSRHFFVRGDPGTRLATLAASRNGLRLVASVSVPESGHCLTGDGAGYYWTCDASGGRVLRFDDR